MSAIDAGASPRWLVSAACLLLVLPSALLAAPIGGGADGLSAERLVRRLTPLGLSVRRTPGSRPDELRIRNA